MKKLFLLALVFSLTCIDAFSQPNSKLPSAECQKDDKRVQVLLLASYHMSNPGADRFNMKADDVLTEKRQAEIEKLVKDLSAFKPTKVALEFPYGNPALSAEYQKYLKGERALTRNERDQIGFRLAKALGHADVYAIDVAGNMDFASLNTVVAANPKFQANMAELQKFGTSATAMTQKWLETNTISGMLYHLNSPETLAHGYRAYIDIFTPMAHGDNYAGADLTADWYKRNLRIFANLDRISADKDRVLVVYGTGHIPVLKQIMADSSRFCAVDPLAYLEKGK